jgi:TrmH family RNA methyltransferase
VPVRLGVHAERLHTVASLHTVKGRRQSGRFAFEGPTLLREARACGFPIDEIYATQASYDAEPLIGELEAGGTAAYVVGPTSARRISDLESPPGIVAVSPVRLAPLEEIFGGDGIVLVLADVNDPGNAGTLLRSAEAFGCRGVVAGSLGADPYHPKVIRSAMGALFRLPIAVASPEDVRAAADGAGYTLAGLSTEGEALESARLGERAALAVGNERHGLARWDGVIDRRLAIEMRGGAESLNAAVAGSIALYEAAKRFP